MVTVQHFSQGSPVTSSKSLSPLNKKTRSRGGGARIPGFPQRVTSASVSSVCDTSGHSELRDTSDNAAGHKTVDIELDTTGSVSKHNLSLQLLGTVLLQSQETYQLTTLLMQTTLTVSKNYLIILPNSICGKHQYMLWW